MEVNELTKYCADEAPVMTLRYLSIVWKPTFTEGTPDSEVFKYSGFKTKLNFPNYLLKIT